MNMASKNIAVLYGGDSSEYVVSERSAKEVISVLESSSYKLYPVSVKGTNWIYRNGEQEVPLDLNTFTLTMPGKEKISFDFALIIIHGPPGEDGKLQAILDMHKIPYNTPGVFESALSFNKNATKLYLKNFGILTPESFLVNQGDAIDIEKIVNKVGLPCFVKPNKGGSSFGITKVTSKEDIKPAIQESFKEDNEVIIETFIKGTELSCGLMKTKDKEYIFPVTEIVPKNEFFDYEAKYTEGMADEIVPARVDEEIQKKCQLLASEIYDYTNCRGLIRMDFILKGNQLYFLELNTVPGMSRESIVPKMIRGQGYTVLEILEELIRDGMNN